MCMYVYNTTISLSLSVVCLWNKHEHWDALLIGMILVCFIELYCVQKGLGSKLLDPKKGIARNPYTMLLQWRARPIHVPVQTGSQFTSYCRSWLRLVGSFLLSFHCDEAILIGPAEQFEVAIAATFVRMMQEGQFTISFPGWPLGSMTIHDIWGLGIFVHNFSYGCPALFRWGGEYQRAHLGKCTNWVKRCKAYRIRSHLRAPGQKCGTQTNTHSLLERSNHGQNISKNGKDTVGGFDSRILTQKR